MSERIARIVVGLLALFVLAQLVLVARLWQRSRAATIAVRATNAGVPLPASEARVSVYAAGDAAHIVAEGHTGEALALPPGKYDLRVTDTQARDGHTVWLRGVSVAANAQATPEVALSAGELQVDVEDGAAAAEPGVSVAYVFRPDDHDRVVTSMGAGRVVRLAAGPYDVRVVLTVNSEERAVEWLRAVPVEVGLRALRRVTFRRGTLSLEAYNAGQKLLPAAVSLTVIRAGDSQEEEVERGSAGLPLSLPVGRYDVRATFTGSHDEPVRWVRSVEILERETAAQRVDFASGTAVVHARAADAALGPYDAYAYFYRAGDHQQAVAYVPAGEPVILAAGRYDVRLNYFRAHDQPDVWRYDLPIEAGATVTETISFASGRLLLRAFGADGCELVGDDIFVYVHAAGEHARPIITARSGEVVVLAAGIYDLHAIDTRQPAHSTWVRSLDVRPGALVERSVQFR